ncbi:MAG: DUF664 domain-containing protein [Armatimonadetes bacterium]|nr:DUF664 domain-containing protein [Armatimonadota bacterium]
MTADDLARPFLELSVWRLSEDYLPKLRRCLDELSEEQVWWRPNEQCNSVGNLLLHLAGNLRQWVIAGVGGAPNHRDRPAEFAARGPVPKAELLAGLEAAVSETCAVIRQVKADDLLPPRRIQVYDDQTPLYAIYHVVEHFAGHTGQVLYITKLLGGVDLGFYGYLNP